MTKYQAGIAVGAVANSLSTFTFTIAIARVLGPSDFGITCLFWLVSGLLLSATRAIFSEQILVGSNQKDKLGLMSFAFYSSLVISVVATLAVTLHGNLTLLAPVLWFGIAVGLDPVRYANIPKKDVEYKFRVMPGIDLLRMLCGILAFFTTYVTSPENSYYIVSALSLISSMFWLFIIRDFRLRLALNFIKNRGRFEMFLTAQFVISSSVNQLLPLMALSNFGETAFGWMRLAQATVAPANTMSSMLQPNLLVYFANLQNSKAQLKVTIKYVGLAVGFSILALAALLAFVTNFSGFLYSIEPPEYFQSLLAAASASVISSVAGQPGGAFIRVHKMGGVSLSGQLLGLTIGSLICLNAVSMGIGAFAWALSSVTFFTVIFTYCLLLFVRIQWRGGGSNNN